MTGLETTILVYGIVGIVIAVMWLGLHMVK